MSRQNREDVILGEIAELQRELKAVKRNQKWQCPHCQKKSKILNIALEDHLYYIEPYGCTGGDRHSHSHYEIRCPKCGESEDYYPSPYDPDSASAARYKGVVSMRRSFKATETIYPKKAKR